MARIGWRSLKARITLFTLAIFLISIWSLAFYVSYSLRGDMQRLLGKQQFATASFRADEVNRVLGEHLSALGRIAATLDRKTLADRSALAEFLAARPALDTLFNGGVSVVGKDGVVLAATPSAAGRLGFNYGSLESIDAALAHGKSTIGPALADVHLPLATFDISAPVRDADGNVIGALSGTTRLAQANFLDPIIESYYGLSGYYLLVDPQRRQIVTDTGKQRVLAPLAPVGSDPLFDRFVAGSDEAGVTRDAAGQEILMSAKRVHLADWFIVAALPTVEAFALIDAMRAYMMHAALVLTVLAGAATWWMIRRELAPILSAMKTLGSLAQSGTPRQLLPVASGDEIGRLIGGFNHLLEALQQRETSLQNALRFQQVLMDAVPSPIFYKDANRVYLGMNSAYERYFGLTRADLVGKTVHDIAPTDLATMYDQADRALLASGGVQTYETSVVHADGTRHAAIFSKATFTNAEGRVTGLVGVILDINERKQAEDLIRNLAFYDQLTGLPNRRLLNDRLQQLTAASRRSDQHCALLFLDLDNFKPLNDLHGHAAGDLLLVEVSHRLRQCVRATDTAARFGGDEFVILLGDLSEDPDDSTRLALNVADKVRDALSRPYRLNIRHEDQAPSYVEHHCTASIGVALQFDHDGGLDDLLTRADSALYKAKAGGRNQVRLYYPAA